MREPLTDEDVEDEMYTPGPDDDEGRRRAAERILAWAQDPHPDDEMSAGDLQVQAGELLQLVGDHEAALKVFRRAVATGESTILDARACVVDALFRLERAAEAWECSEQLRRSRPTNATTYYFMGEAWEGRDDVKQALGWFNRGLILAEEQAAEEFDLELLRMGRWRVRQSMGMEPDEHDRIAIARMEAASGSRQG